MRESIHACYTPRTMPDMPSPVASMSTDASSPKPASGHGVTLAILIILVVLNLAGTAAAFYLFNANANSIRKELVASRQEVTVLSEQVNTTTDQLEEMKSAIEEARAMMEMKSGDTSSGFHYQNDASQFSLDFPPSWGTPTVSQRGPGNLSWQTVTLQSPLDSKKTVDVHIRSAAGADADPSWGDLPYVTHLAQKGAYVYAMTTVGGCSLSELEQPECIQVAAEIAQIIGTFRIVN